MKQSKKNCMKFLNAEASLKEFQNVLQVLTKTVDDRRAKQFAISEEKKQILPKKKTSKVHCEIKRETKDET